MQYITLKIASGMSSEEMDEMIEYMLRLSNRTDGLKIDIYDTQSMIEFGTHFYLQDDKVVQDESKYWRRDVYEAVHQDDWAASCLKNLKKRTHADKNRKR